MPHWVGHGSVSTLRSSNRTGGSPESGSRTRLHAFSRVTPSAVSERFSELPGCPISRSLTASCVGLELRPLPSPGITRLHRCRVGGGALDCSRAGLRPPLKLGVQFSRTQLSQRRRSLSGDGRDHRNQVHKPVLAVELTAWQRSPTAAAPLVVPVRPDPPYQPSVEPVEELSDVARL